MKLGVNIDHVATVRQARLASEPNVIKAAILAEMGGADGITVHLRKDRRHIQDDDVRTLEQAISTNLNFEMSLDTEIVNIALQVQPYMCTIVPEGREELTTEGGLDISNDEIRKNTELVIKRLKNRGIKVSLFLDPKTDIMKTAKEIGADYVEIHTGNYSDAEDLKEQEEELTRVKEAVKAAKVLNLKVNAGHGLDYKNIEEIAKIEGIEEVNIGHSIVGKAIFVGMENAVRQMKEAINNA
ncbi:MAG: pyridoxine 5'-phosphate synthase [Fusobacteriota bacterium]